MSSEHIDYQAIGSKSDAIDHLARGTAVGGIPDAEIAGLWADVERLEIDAHLTVHRYDWAIVPKNAEEAA